MAEDILERQLDTWRHDLLERVCRSALVDYPATDTLRIVSPSAPDLFQRLVLDGETLTFRRQADVSDNEALSRLLYLMDSIHAPVELSTGDLSSNQSMAEMNQTLATLRAVSCRTLQERGVHTLFLSFGLLRWQPEGAEDTIYSPLLLVPVTLGLSHPSEPYTISCLDDEVVVNPALPEQRLHLPPFHYKEEALTAYFAQIEDLGWPVVSDVHLGLLSFLQVYQVQDLERTHRRLLAHSVVRALCGHTPFDSPSGRRRAKEAAQPVYPVLSADDTQRAALALAARGSSFVLEGAPGTGKTQTIVNMIAGAMQDGKKVLVVSEKMAVLRTLGQRLEAVGLADFCLCLYDLHTDCHGVVRDLLRTLDAPVKNLRAGATDAQADLTAEQATLDSYIQALWQPRQPLGMAIAEVIVELLDDTTYVYEYRGDTRKLTAHALRERVDTLEKMAEALRVSGPAIYTNPWRDTSLTELTPDVRELIGDGLGALLSDLHALYTALHAIGTQYAPDTVWTLRNFSEHIAGLTAHALERETEQALRARYGDVDGKRLKTYRSDLADAVLKMRGYDIADAAIAQADVPAMDLWLSKLHERKAYLETCVALTKQLRTLFPDDVPNNRDGLDRAILLLDILDVPYPVKPAWFQGRHSPYATLEEKIQQWRQTVQSLQHAADEIDVDWERGFYDLQASEILHRFETKYNSFFRRLLPRYMEENRYLAELYKADGDFLSYKLCLDGLHKLQRYQEYFAQFQKDDAEARNLLAELYTGVHTDWDRALRVVRAGAPVYEYIRAHGASHSLLAFFNQTLGERMRALSDATGGKTCAALREEIQAIGDCEPEERQKRPADKKTRGKQDNSFSKELGFISHKIEHLTRLLDVCRELEGVLATVSPDAAHLNVATLTERIQSMEQITNRFAAYKQKIATAFPKSGNACDCALITMLDDLRGNYGDPVPLSEKVSTLCDIACGGNMYAVKAFENSLNHAVGDLQLPAHEMQTLKTISTWFSQRQPLTMPLPELIDWLSSCQQVEVLQHWLDFAPIWHLCVSQGLSGYLSFARDTAMPLEQIVPCYRRGVLEHWLDETLQSKDLDVLQGFYAWGHEKVVSSFASHVAWQQQLTQARLVDQLTHRKPDGANPPVGMTSEVRTLRREERERVLTTPRQLFRRIPTLLQALRPCFLLSPLVVPYLLDSDVYAFDMVIFDDSTGIRLEDAIAAVGRGQQLICAGDHPQLAERVPEDTCHTGEAVSLFDAAKAHLPCQTLQWHYRSCDETLIEFSNRQLYQGALRTFPSPERQEERGLEYIYDRSGVGDFPRPDCNLHEAQLCLVLLLEHIRRHPERSLGVITLTEAQRDLIESLLEEKLHGDSFPDQAAYAAFVQAHRDEPVFVKYMEHVQGDVRDTIVLSLGYGRNAQGRMPTDFGPLERPGGERYLHVAITRSRYNLKVVSTLLPADISERRDTPAGVRMLRQYLRYAISHGAVSGLSLLPNTVTWPAPVDEMPPDPFADSIVRFLERNGYSCVRNVGTSPYRVDIGVRESAQSQTMLAGLVCDGPMYASIPSACERDVLTLQMLHARGWKMYHVWSIAWVSDPEGEQRRLLRFLYKCASHADADAPDSAFDEIEELDAPHFTSFPEQADLFEEVPDTGKGAVLHFDTYQCADPLQAPCLPEDDQATQLARRILWVVEKEQPMHMEELYRRMTVVFQRQKVTPAIREAVDRALQSHLHDTIERRDEFLYLRGAEIRARAPETGEAPRTIDRICPEEIQDAICRVLAFSGSLDLRTLVGETAWHLGYVRAGSKISGRVEENCQRLIQSECIEERGGELHWMGGATRG